jgi:hypothetical protein
MLRVPKCVMKAFIAALALAESVDIGTNALLAAACCLNSRAWSFTCWQMTTSHSVAA